MALYDTCVRRPVFATMLNAILVVLGIFSFFQLGLDLFPKIDLPTLAITTTFTGAAPEEIEAQITKPLEEAINTIAGIDELRSTSLEGVSQVIVVFKLDKNADIASQEVRDRISRVMPLLPEGVRAPVIQKFDPDAAPVIVIAVSGELPIRTVTELARKRVKEPLESVSGVGSIEIVGGREREIRIILDADKLAGYAISVQQVVAALQQENVEIPGGRVERVDRELVLRTVGRVVAPEEFGEIVVARRARSGSANDAVEIRVRDIGRVVDGEENARTVARYDAQTAVTVVVRKQSGQNTVEVVNRVKQRLEEIRPLLPPGLKAEIVRNQADFIVGSIHEVYIHLILGGLLAALTTWFFMRDWRSTLIAGIAIPVSLIATLTLMRAMGFTLNNMTLLGLTIAVGIVIDDALVVLENIFRHIDEEGQTPFNAAMTGTREISLAVMATTLSLVVIFLPIGFMGGIVGRFLSSFGLTVACAIMVSLLVSFTLTPMLCARLLKHGQAGHDQESRLNRALQDRYTRMLEWSLIHRKSIVALAVLVVLLTVPAFMVVGKDFFPPDDQSEFEVTVSAPEGWTMDRSLSLAAELEARIREFPEIAHILTSIGEGDAASVGDIKIYVRMTPLDDRKITQFEVMAMARRLLAAHPELRGAVQHVSAISGGGFRAQLVNINLRGPELDKLADYTHRLLGVMKKIPGLVDLDSTLKIGKPELRVRIDRKRAGDLGVSARDIADALRFLVGGDLKVSDFREGDEVYNVKVRAEEKDRMMAADIARLPIQTRSGSLVPLSAVATIEEATGPTQIDRQNRQRQVTLLANLAPGGTLGDAVEKIEAEAKKLQMPADYRFEFSGRAKTLAESNRNFVLAFALSFIFMYMILAAQFESFIHPITIMLALPLSIPFALISLALGGMSINIYSILGLFMLFGVVKKNGILQIDYTNTLRARGVERHQAIIEANRTRLRPILMTTITLVLAMVPLALGRGPGSASRASMAVAIIGGQSLSLLISLLVTPVAYSYFDDLTQWVRRRYIGAPPTA